MSEPEMNGLLAALIGALEDHFEKKPDWHYHVCPLCSHVWYHNRQAIPDGADEYEKAHTCPECGKGKQRTKEFTEEAAQASAVAYRHKREAHQ